MNITHAQRAAVITEALPYIQKYNNKIIVVKYGGNAILKGISFDEGATAIERNTQIGGHKA